MEGEILDTNTVKILKYSEDDSEKSNMTNTTYMIKLVSDNLRDFLIEKNKRYGNAALDPMRVTSKLSSDEQIKIRIDDKLNRIKNSEKDRENDWLDLVGYIILFMIKKNWTDFKKYLD